MGKPLTITQVPHFNGAIVVPLVISKSVLRHQVGKCPKENGRMKVMLTLILALVSMTALAVDIGDVEQAALRSVTRGGVALCPVESDKVATQPPEKGGCSGGVQFDLDVVDGVVTGDSGPVPPGEYYIYLALCNIDLDRLFNNYDPNGDQQTVTVTSGQTSEVVIDLYLRERLTGQFYVPMPEGLDSRGITSVSLTGADVIDYQEVPGGRLRVDISAPPTFDGGTLTIHGHGDTEYSGRIETNFVEILNSDPPQVEFATGSVSIVGVNINRPEPNDFIQGINTEGNFYYDSLQSAVDAGCWDIHLGEGEYTGFVADLVGQDLAVHGLGVNKTKLVPLTDHTDPVVYAVGADSFVLGDVCVRGQDKTNRSLVIWQSNHVAIRHCLVHNDNAGCLDSSDNRFVLIDQTAMLGPGAGNGIPDDTYCSSSICAVRAENLTVRNSIIIGVCRGITVDSVDDMSIGRNYFYRIGQTNCYNSGNGQAIELEDNFDGDPMLWFNGSQMIWTLTPNSPCWYAGYEGQTIGPRLTD